MMIMDAMPSTRTTCSQILVQFLVNYPLESKRIKQHLNFLLKNSGFKSESGRIAVLETLKLVIERFPLEVLDNFAELLFFSFALRLANDRSAEVKKTTFEVLKKLLQRTERWPQMLSNVLSIHAKTLEQPEDEEEEVNFEKRDLLQKTQCHLLSLFVQVLGDSKLKSKDLTRIFDALLVSILKETEIWRETCAESKP